MFDSIGHEMWWEETNPPLGTGECLLGGRGDNGSGSHLSWEHFLLFILIDAQLATSTLGIITGRWYVHCKQLQLVSVAQHTVPSTKVLKLYYSTTVDYTLHLAMHGAIEE